MWTLSPQIRNYENENTTFSIYIEGRSKLSNSPILHSTTAKYQERRLDQPTETELGIFEYGM